MKPAPSFRQPVVTRRRFMQGVGGLALAGATTVAPFAAQAQTTVQLNLALSASLIPGVDDFTRQLVDSWGADNGVTFDIAFIALSDLPARVDRILRGGELRDIVELQELQPFRMTDRLVDISDLVATNIAEQGEYHPWAQQTVQVNGVWLSIPIGGVPVALTYRPSFLEQAGGAVPPTTWEEFFDRAMALKVAGLPPAGQALRQTPVTAPGFAYAFMWSQGASEVSPNTRAVRIDSPEFAAALTTFGAAWPTGFDPAGTEQDDTDSAMAFLQAQTSMRISGPDIWAAANLVGDTDVAVAPIPEGPAGRFIPLGSRSLGISQRSANIEVARQFLAWWTEQTQFSQWMVAQQGAIIPPNEPLMELPVFASDENIRVFIDALANGRVRGYSAAPSLASAEVANNYFVVNTFADVAKGTAPEIALDRAQQLIERYYLPKP